MFRDLLDRPAVKATLSLFTREGHDIVIVGGAVRDHLLGLPVTDLDFATSARPDEIKRILALKATELWSANSRGTIGAVIEGEQVEVSTFKGRKSLKMDLARRDLTINAMAVLPDGRLVDPHGGRHDINRRLIRFARVSAVDADAGRIMRAYRFASQLGFDVDQSTQNVIASKVGKLRRVAAERVGVELRLLLLGKAPSNALRGMVHSGAADIVLPELSALDMPQKRGRPRHKDVLEHSLRVLDNAIKLEAARGHAPDLMLRFAALLHDIGKPATRRYEANGTVTFHGHEAVGANLARQRLKALRFPKKFSNRVRRLVALHMRAHSFQGDMTTDSMVRRLMTDAGNQLERLIILFRADVTSRRAERQHRRAVVLDQLEARIAEVRAKDEAAAVRGALNGREVMELLDLPPGPDVGRATKFLKALHVEEGPLSKDEAAGRLIEWWERQAA